MSKLAIITLVLKGCWALIFIFRLRFPPVVSIATILKRRHIQNSLNYMMCPYFYIARRMLFEASDLLATER